MTIMKLKISEDLSLPLEAVTQKLAFLGRTGSGKSYGATKLCELMLEAHAQVVALDPVGVWWGLRTAGKGKGFAIPVFGGLHGDLPLNEHSGVTVADMIVDRNISAVLDVSQMLAGEQRRFATDFVTQLFQRKKAAPSAMHLFIEECQEFVPQNVGREEGRMVHAFERLIKLGRNFGIGASLLSQRPQEVNKKALNQTECLFAFQMTGPQERKAIESWVSEKGVTDNIVDQLPKLRVGEPHIWSPAWLRESKTIRIAAKRTADVSSTPKLGQKEAPHALTSVDLEELREQMQTTIEEAEANDPEQLNREITRLKKENARLQLPQAAPMPALTEEEIGLLRETRVWGEGFGKHLEKLAADFNRGLDVALEAVRRLGPVTAKADAIMQKNLHKRTVTAATPAVRTNASSTTANGIIGGSGMRRIMIALAQRPGLSAKQIGTRAGMSSKSGTFGTYLGKLRSNGWVDGGRDRMVLTQSGIAALGDYDPLPTGSALLGYWLGELGGGSGAARMLQALAEAYPSFMTKEELGSSAQISHTSGTFGTYVGKLRSLELIEGKGELRASADLFD
jgi:hypothetical protein